MKKSRVSQNGRGPKCRRGEKRSAVPVTECAVIRTQTSVNGGPATAKPNGRLGRAKARSASRGNASALLPRGTDLAIPNGSCLLTESYVNPPASKPPREQVPPDACLCDFCTAKCCRYFALPFDKPTCWREFDQMRWFLLHERAAVFVEKGAWYVLAYNPCRHLRPDHRCGIYETRPQICRDYSTKNCEYEDSWVYDHYWELPEQVEEYAEAVLGPRRGRSFRSPRPS